MMGLRRHLVCWPLFWAVPVLLASLQVCQGRQVAAQPRGLQEAPGDCHCTHPAIIAVPCALGPLILLGMAYALRAVFLSSRPQLPYYNYSRDGRSEKQSSSPGTERNKSVNSTNGTNAQVASPPMYAVEPEVGARHRPLSQGAATVTRRRRSMHEPWQPPTQDGLYLDPSTVAHPLEGIDLTRQGLLAHAHTAGVSQELSDLSMLSLLGKGTYGCVYKASWKGVIVAVKVMILTGSERSEKMAVMEAAISSSLSHPNIVQTYTFAVKALPSGGLSDRRTNNCFAGRSTPLPRLSTSRDYARQQSDSNPVLMPRADTQYERSSLPARGVPRPMMSVSAADRLGSAQQRAQPEAGGAKPGSSLADLGQASAVAADIENCTTSVASAPEPAAPSQVGAPSMQSSRPSLLGQNMALPPASPSRLSRGTSLVNLLLKQSISARMDEKPAGAQDPAGASETSTAEPVRLSPTDDPRASASAHLDRLSSAEPSRCSVRSSAPDPGGHIVRQQDVSSGETPLAARRTPFSLQPNPVFQTPLATASGQDTPAVVEGGSETPRGRQSQSQDVQTTCHKTPNSVWGRVGYLIADAGQFKPGRSRHSLDLHRVQIPADPHYPAGDAAANAPDPTQGAEAQLVIVGGKDGTAHAGDASGGAGDLSEGLGSWELRLVQEFCEAGSLRDLLDKGGFTGRSGGVDVRALVDTVMDIARAMEHLHSQNIVHSDLKPRNVLLKANPLSSRGFIAKVADFGLSVRLQQETRHVANVFQGTLSHMAPEVLIHGHLGKPVDVYAFGMVLWECYTGERAYKGLGKLALIDAITLHGLRPSWPAGAPAALVSLANQCWVLAPAARPTFTEILTTLSTLATELMLASRDALMESQGSEVSHGKLDYSSGARLSKRVSSSQLLLSTNDCSIRSKRRGPARKQASFAHPLVTGEERYSGGSSQPGSPALALTRSSSGAVGDIFLDGRDSPRVSAWSIASSRQTGPAARTGSVGQGVSSQACSPMSLQRSASSAGGLYKATGLSPAADARASTLWAAATGPQEDAACSEQLTVLVPSSAGDGVLVQGPTAGPVVAHSMGVPVKAQQQPSGLADHSTNTSTSKSCENALHWADRTPQDLKMEEGSALGVETLDKQPGRRTDPGTSGGLLAALPAGVPSARAPSVGSVQSAGWVVQAGGGPLRGPPRHGPSRLGSATAATAPGLAALDLQQHTLAGHMIGSTTAGASGLLAAESDSMCWHAHAPELQAVSSEPHAGVPRGPAWSQPLVAVVGSSTLVHSPRSGPSDVPAEGRRSTVLATVLETPEPPNSASMALGSHESPSSPAAQARWHTIQVGPMQGHDSQRLASSNQSSVTTPTRASLDLHARESFEAPDSGGVYMSTGFAGIVPASAAYAHFAHRASSANFEAAETDVRGFLGSGDTEELEPSCTEHPPGLPPHHQHRQSSSSSQRSFYLEHSDSSSTS